MNYIKENLQGAKFHTSLRDIERWLEIDLKDYDWHISDVEGAWPELNDPSWITGEKLSTKIREYDYQFVWAVLSAFPKNSEPRTTSKPYAEGNSALWENSPRKQMRDSLFEIVCWDSSATLFIGLPDNLSNNLLVNAPGIKELNNENKERRESL